MILMDTHTLVWWVASPAKLSPLAKSILDASPAKDKFLVSAISFWEIALLVTKHKLKLSQSLDAWLNQIKLIPDLTIIYLTADIAVASVTLPDFTYPDPADRIIAATALTLNCPLITKDQKLHAYPRLQCIW